MFVCLPFTVDNDVCTVLHLSCVIVAVCCVQIVFPFPPPFGMELEACVPGSLSYGIPAGDPLATRDAGAIVKAIPPGGQASEIPSIRPGVRLVEVAGKPTTSMTFAETMALLSTLRQPATTMKFRDPYAVPPHVAEYCKDTRNHLVDIPWTDGGRAAPAAAPARTAHAHAPVAAFNPAEWHARDDAHGRYYMHVTGRTSRVWPPS